MERGDVLTLFGRNGAGKSTFLHIAATLMKPSAGEILYGGRSLSEDPAGVRRQIGLVSHASFLYPDLTARENLEFYARLYHVPDRSSAVEQALERAELSARKDAAVRSLSRGMEQRLSIARALLHRPSLLLLDEPYTGLDLISAEHFSRQIGELGSQGTAVILTTHDLERGLGVADRVVILESGRLFYESSGEADPEELRRIFSEAARGNRPPGRAAGPH